MAVGSLRAAGLSVGQVVGRIDTAEPVASATSAARHGEQYGEWSASDYGPRPCTSQWPGELITSLYGLPPPFMQPETAVDQPITSIHLAPTLDDAADSASDDDDEELERANTIIETIRANAAAVVRCAVYHLIGAPTLEATLTADVVELCEALAESDADATTQAIV